MANFGAFVVDPEPAKLLHALFGIQVPPAPRNDLVAVFATGVPGLNQPASVSPGEMLRLNMSIPPAKRPSHEESVELDEIRASYPPACRNSLD